MSKPVVLITSRYSDDLVAKLEPYATVRLGADQFKGTPRAEILEVVGDAVGLITQNELKIDRELLEHAKALRVVANSTAGFDNMDIAAMRERGIWGANCPDSYSADTCEPHHRPPAGPVAGHPGGGPLCALRPVEDRGLDAGRALGRRRARRQDHGHHRHGAYRLSGRPPR